MALLINSEPWLSLHNPGLGRDTSLSPGARAELSHGGLRRYTGFFRVWKAVCQGAVLLGEGADFMKFEIQGGKTDRKDCEASLVYT